MKIYTNPETWQIEIICKTRLECEVVRSILDENEELNYLTTKLLDEPYVLTTMSTSLRHIKNLLIDDRLTYH